MARVRAQRGRQRGINSASFVFARDQIIGVAPSLKAKDWGCGHQKVWFSWTTGNQSSGRIEEKNETNSRTQGAELS